jgi:hypothetical protein
MGEGDEGSTGIGDAGHSRLGNEAEVLAREGRRQEALDLLHGRMFVEDRELHEIKGGTLEDG